MSCGTTIKYYGPSIPDTAVIYTGEGCPDKGICTGNNLKEVLEILVGAFCAEAATDPDIDVTANCSYISLSNKKLKTILQALLDAACKLNTDITNTNIYIDTKTALSLNGKCISLPTGSSLTINNVFQAIIDYVCALQTGSATTATTILTTVFNAIDSCQKSFITKSGTGANQTLSIKGRNPVGTYLWGDYNLSDFDASGIGKSGTDMCNAVLADGRNGTWDMRGMVPMGATTYGSGALNSLVDPTTNGDPDYAINQGQVKGKVKVAHTANNNGTHIHNIPTKQVAITRGETCTITVFDSTCDGGITTTSTTASSGLATPTENRQPSRGGIWIKIVS